MTRKRTSSASEMIYDALCTLLIEKQKEYSELSIQDIVDEAGVCRNSFYRSYDSKDDILIRKYDELFLQDSKTEVSSYTQFLNDIFETVKENKRFFLAFYHSNTGKYFDLISKHLIRSNTDLDIDQIDAEHYYHYASKAWIGLGIITEWVKRGCDMPVSELSDLLLNFDIRK